MPSELNEETVRHVAALARLKVTPEEVQRLAADLSNVLSHMRQLDELETDGVAPTAHAIPLRNVFRDDVSQRSPVSGDALANAPLSQDGFFRVPKVLGQGGGA